MIEMSRGIDWLVLNAISSCLVRFPPHTAQVLECDLDIEMSNFIIEPVNVYPMDVASRTYNASENKGKLCVMNMTDRSYIVKTESDIEQQQQLVQSKKARLQCVGC